MGRKSHTWAPLRCQQKTNFVINFFCLLLFEGTFTSFKKKSQKESQKGRIQGFSCYFCIMIEGSGYLWLMNPDTDRWGPKTCGSSGSGSATLAPTPYSTFLCSGWSLRIPPVCPPGRGRTSITGCPTASFWNIARKKLIHKIHQFGIL